MLCDGGGVGGDDDTNNKKKGANLVYFTMYVLSAFIFRHLQSSPQSIFVIGSCSDKLLLCTP
jgi:hypothetical protein